MAEKAIPNRVGQRCWPGRGALAEQGAALRRVSSTGGWLLAATVIAGGFNYLANVWVGKLLGPEEYGVYAALLALAAVLGSPVGVIQIIMASYTAQLTAVPDATRRVGAVLIQAQRWLLPWAIGGALAVMLSSGLIASWLHIPSLVPVVVVGCSLLPTVLLPVAMGALQGLQRFGPLGGGQIATAALRLGIGVGLILLGGGVSGALAGSVLAGLGAFGLGCWWLRDVYRAADTTAAGRYSPNALFRFSLNVVLSTLGLLLLMNGDLLAVKSRFPPLEAGLYSAVVTLGRIVLFIPGAVVALMFPKVAGRYASGQPTTGLAWRSLLAVMGLCGCAALILLAGPRLIVQWLYGPQFLGQAALLGRYGVAMLLLALVNVWAQYFMAIREARYAWLLVGMSVLQAVVLFCAPLSLTGVIWCLTACNGLLVLAGAWLVRNQRRRRVSVGVD